jgi:hypothetical protein
MTCVDENTRSREVERSGSRSLEISVIWSRGMVEIIERWKAVAKTLPQERFQFDTKVEKIDASNKVAHLSEIRGGRTPRIPTPMTCVDENTRSREVERSGSRSLELPVRHQGRED